VRPTYQRCVFVATAALLAAGCGSGGGQTLTQAPQPAGGKRLRVQAPWLPGATIPRRYTCDGDNVTPRIAASGARGAAQLAIVMTDPDAPGGTFVHWTAWGARQGRNSFGKVGYDGPCPPKGDRPHRYVITVYALRRRLALAAGGAPDQVLAAIRKIAFASGSITGLYGR
jgi:phosphatidylethanolamine-binding protein (PEBP) family uncharacterized protein